MTEDDWGPTTRQNAALVFGMLCASYIAVSVKLLSGGKYALAFIVLAGPAIVSLAYELDFADRFKAEVLNL